MDKNEEEKQGDWFNEYQEVDNYLFDKFNRNDVPEMDGKNPSENTIKLIEAYQQQSLSKLEKILPDSYYTGIDFEERLKMLVKHWQRAIKLVNKFSEIENKVLNLQKAARDENWSMVEIHADELKFIMEYDDPKNNESN